MASAASSSSRPKKFHDWTRDPLPPDLILTPFQQFIRSVEWNKSPVGPMNKWPSWLRQQVLFLVRDPAPAAVYVGEEQTVIYNEAYALLVGQKHPSLMGQDPHIGLAELWAKFHDVIRAGEETGQPHVDENQLLPLSRFGYLEEIYYSYRFIPIVGDKGYVVGHHVLPKEVTRDILSDRRTLMTQTMAVRLAECKSMEEFWPSLLAGFEPSDKDFPIVALYASSQHVSQRTSEQSRINCLLEGCLGVSQSHVPSRLILPRASRAAGSVSKAIEKLLATLFYKALNSTGPLLVTRDMLSDSFLKGVTWRGFGIPSQEFLIIPLRTSKGIVAGFVFTGLNPMKRYHQDSDFADHVKMITQQVIIPRASSILLAKEVRQGEERLTIRSEELKQSEANYRNFAGHSPVGVALISSDRCIEFANEAWFQITNQSRQDTSPKPWLNVVHNDDFEKFDTFIAELIACKGVQTVEARLDRSCKFQSEDDASTDSSQHPAWILASGYSEMKADGQLGYAVVWITDISTQKAVERSLDARVKKALEMKRQQENFVDNICHEIRNPASAMLHCAEEIATHVQDCLKATLATPNLSVAVTHQRPDHAQIREWLNGSLDAAQTIVNCVNHQRSIVDDVLTLSKLDSNLLSISPVVVEPGKVVREAMKLFEGEMRNASIKWSVYTASSLKDLGANWVMLDPGRIHQVIINLLTNAIKFTRNRDQREINVRLSTVSNRPTMAGLNCEYFPKSTKHSRKNSKIRLDDEHGSEIYLIFAVTDTGKGLSNEERSRLFERFAQGSPKTYTQYGGSGLGLWISREIAEMMDGEIGVVSEEGVGSTFTFFVRTQVAKPPVGHKTISQLGVTDPLSRSVSPMPMSGGLSPRNILIVEDNLVNQKVLCKALKNRGYNVLAADHGGEALEALYRIETYRGPGSTLLQWPPFDVILMDIEMPHMDGITCIQKIRALENEGALKGHITAIAVTANARPDHATAALEAGMDGVTTKPYRVDDLVVQINKIFSKARRIRGNKASS